ncbi:hypothetical protein NLU13_9700 [Sarocladium strictum]|uniref:Zn(2)-C6 fungal-type domain-containing protein n=1 Tax=Sarocladium strictum TaxID=5046 RepID=A0AA39GB82_SARSR|nr:hypothetical protein NLU13_9700 [Sarocladium strictum]
MDAASGETPRKRRTRKPRGRGLRTRTGCLTCRKRHKKCDERQPVCGPCSTTSRPCVFPRDLDAQSALEALTQAPHRCQPLDRSNTSSRGSPRGEDQHGPEQFEPAEGSHLSPISDAQTSQVHQDSPNGIFIPGVSPQDLNSHGSLPSWPSDCAYRQEKWTANFASTRWLDLLANDAAQADGSFSLAPSPEPESRRIGEQQRQSAIAAHVSPALLHGQAQLPSDLDPESERQAWQLAQNAVLADHEASLLRHFADHCAPWLDIFDPHSHFSTYVIRLSLKNTGLLKAILALSAKHRATCMGTPLYQGTTHLTSPAAQMTGDVKDSEWIGYYYETLHYIRSALLYKSYTHSEELLATAIVISSYEMLDEADGSGNWQRHLKGVFWIQRSQEVDGVCGGLRQAVWWAWHRQDTWAAFRERRACFSFWLPKQPIEDLSQPDLAKRAIYLLAQAVNYSAEAWKVESGSGTDPMAEAQLKQRRDQLLSHMDRWKRCLGEEFDVLPTSKTAKDVKDDVFTPLWIHPPEYGVAVQAYNLAIILITLHTPNVSGLNAFLKMQKQLASAVEIICGIAMELKDEGYQILCAQYLYGAGICVQDALKRQKIIQLMEECESRVKWAPIATWRDDLRMEWAKADSDMIDQA